MVQLPQDTAQTTNTQHNASPIIREKEPENTVMARATDAHERVQPMQHNPDHRSYKISHVLPINVEVR